MQSGIDLLTLMTTGVLPNPVGHAGDWGSVRPWPRSLPEGQNPDGIDDYTPDDEVAKEKMACAIEGCVFLFPKHIDSELHVVNRDERVRNTTQTSEVQRGPQRGELLIYVDAYCP